MTQFIQLNQYQLIEAHGVDAEKYLQGQLTTDVVALASGASTITAHCDPKGKVNAIFRLLKVSSERFFLLVNKDLLPSALEALKKYAVFSKVSFDLRDWQIVGVIGERCGKIQPLFTLEIDEQRAILLNEIPFAMTFNADEKAWHIADIQAGIPHLSAKMQNELIPQAMNLQAIEQAISFTKGCYIGQETVARAKYRGANKRAMFVFKGDTQETPEVGSEIEMQLESHWRKTGTIISAVNIEGVLWLQVVMNNDINSTQTFRLPEDGCILTIQPLPYILN
ncbi:folate-binding protein [Rodentibacter caecimuris]|uniref:CAF17-like 4Fe-4S cluster assembly/insertion protein YgfZ n=1 Tax=Rodentibacter caecimuris TaxID=1796644 RepID=UPI00109487F2|nr:MULTISPECIES: folate-binding protein YgfZ [Pasteurellaceae]MCQ9123519.1 folate-binding protein YgfZ [Rodentibacter heylii]MCX2960921.1 folate-binding protein YgfZ [Rodentibacter heylii]TGY48421.1 folate-binding protein [Pasteurella caecimuris]